MALQQSGLVPEQTLPQEPQLVGEVDQMHTPSQQMCHEPQLVLSCSLLWVHTPPWHLSTVQRFPSSQVASQVPQVQSAWHVCVVQPVQCCFAPGVQTPVPPQVPQVQSAWQVLVWQVPQIVEVVGAQTPSPVQAPQTQLA